MNKEELSELIKNKSATDIAKELDVTYAKVIYYCKKYNLKPQGLLKQGNILDLEQLKKNEQWRRSYAYLLGIFLGNGCLTPRKDPKYHNYEIQIYQDSKYKNIIKKCEKEMSVVIGKTPRTRKRKDVNCCVTVSAAKDLDQIFPHGPGPKHTRKIEFSDWQKQIINEYPKVVLHGLINTDGSRYLSSGKYPVYSFTNKSKDIIDLFMGLAKEIGIEYCYLRLRPDDIWVITIHRKSDVKLLDTFIGPKS